MSEENKKKTKRILKNYPEAKKSKCRYASKGVLQRYFLFVLLLIFKR